MSEPIIQLKHISKSFGKLSILKDVSLTVNQGDSLMIIGPGGSGKSVLMKIIALVIPPDSGDIFYFGKNIKDLSKKEIEKYRLKTGMLFQNYALFDSLTIRGNIGFYLDYHTKTPYKDISKLVTEKLKAVRLEKIEHLKPAELSGGMKKRVGIARAIIHQPEIMFLDEPTAGLDPITTDSISKMISHLQKELSISMIAVTNDMGCARKLGDTLAMLYEGEIYKIGPKQEMMESSDPVVHQFVNGKRKGPIKYHEKIKAD